MFGDNNQSTPQDRRNLTIAAILCLGFIVVWQILYVNPQLEEQRQAELLRQEREAAQEEARREAQAQIEAQTGAGGVEGGAETSAGGGGGGGATGGGLLFGGAPLDVEQALAVSGPRAEIRTPTYQGSIALQGGRIDELLLTEYGISYEEGSERVELLWPQGTRIGYFPLFGWAAGGGVRGPTIQTQWAFAPGSPETLTPETPITLRWENDTGQVFERVIAVDEQYMFTITQRVTNNGGDAIRVKPYAEIRRHGEMRLWDQLTATGDPNQVAGTGWLIHRGPIAVVDGALEEPEYEDVTETRGLFGDQTRTGMSYQVNQLGWLGFTDKYWMTALAPVAHGENAQTSFGMYFERGTSSFQETIYRAGVDYSAEVVATGETYEVSTRFFAGAKRIDALRTYEYQIDGVAQPSGVFGRVTDFFFRTSESRFLDSIDWGWFFFLTKPISELLLAIQSVVGNMGVSIILLTVLFKIILFPLALKSYKSMAKLKLLQPQMKEIQERAGDDRMKMQQEMMALYKREKVNPAAGCLPILAQIPIFFSLYKVLFISIELRHAPFFGWIQDLSAPDPTSIFNLFGVLPYDVPGFLLIGIWPIVMGLTMWIQQMLNPAPTDPIQEKIFAFLPLLFTFMLAGFASGLVVYWTANNLFTIIQQWTIMRSQGVTVDIWANMKRQLGLARGESS